MKLKLKFWKRRGNKAGRQTAKSQKAKSCTQCENASKNVKELEHYMLEMTKQQQRLDGLFKMMDETKRAIAEITASQQEAAEQIGRNDQCEVDHLQQLRRAIIVAKQQQRDEVQRLKQEKEELENEFKAYMANAEQTRREEEKKVQDLIAEIAALKESHHQESQKSQTICSPIPPAAVSGFSYDPTTSAFRVYDHRDHIAPKSQDRSHELPQQSASPMTPEDEEVAAILSNVPQPGEYIRRRYGQNCHDN